MLGGLHNALKSSNLPCLALNGDAGWLRTWPENLDGLLLLLNKVRADTIAEAGTAVLTGNGQDHSSCGP